MDPLQNVAVIRKRLTIKSSVIITINIHQHNNNAESIKARFYCVFEKESLFENRGASWRVG